MDKIPYKAHYPSAARYLIEEGICATPRQYTKELRWADGIDIVYTLKNLTPANFSNYANELLLLAYQEAMRYDQYRWKFAGFDVKLGRLKGKDVPDIVTYQASMHGEPDIMVYGEEALGYDVPQKYFLNNKIKDILDISQRYKGSVSKQAPYRVIRLFISIRQPRR